MPGSAAASARTAEERGFRADLLEILRPANKWHYAFHLVVIAVALTYWVGSLIFQPAASWAEIVMYRPGGDNQVWPVVTALSQFNLGDPTDSLKHGQGIAGFHAVILIPYAIAFAIFGPAGYMLTDTILMWCYFVAATMLFRRWGLHALPSLVLSCGLATYGLQGALNKLSEVPARIATLSDVHFVEWGFPNIFTLNIMGDRVPRPLPTEIIAVLIFYFISRQWLDTRAPTLKRGLIIGALMGLLMQGDPYSFAAMGLVLMSLVIRVTASQQWRFPWRFAAAGIGGALLTGWYFVIQLLFQHPDSAARFGLARYARDKIWILPGTGPWIRLLVIAALVILIRALVRKLRQRIKRNSTAEAIPEPATARILTAAPSYALLAIAIFVGGFAAQPVQLLLLGKGAQIFHYFFYTLPIFYSYAFVLLLIQLFQVLKVSEWLKGASIIPAAVSYRSGVLAGAAAVVFFLFGIERYLDTIAFSGVSRQEVTPWSVVGNEFRPGLRGVDEAFRSSPELKEARSIAALCQEVNFLLTAFHDKRAYLPDNAFTTLSDDELERRLCEMGKLFRMQPEEFAAMIQHQYILNFWLGCAKYWCASDYKFAPESDYPPERLEVVRELPKQSPFSLVLPISEFNRIMDKYVEVLNTPSDTHTYPDAVVVSVVVQEQSIKPDPAIYREAYSNSVFVVYSKLTKS